MIFHDIEQNTPEWMALRSGRLTASMASDSFLSHKTKGFNKIINTICFDRSSSEPAIRQPDSFWLRYGHEVEAETKRQYQAATMNIVKNGGFYASDCGRLGASPDGCIANNGGVEFKSVAGTTLAGYIRANALPKEYEYQIHHQIYVCEFDFVDFYTWAPG